MARPKRADVAGSIYHALNRGNGRALVFHKDEDFEAFERILGEGLELYDVELFALQLMPNHWHMVLRPLVDGEMGRFLGWVTGTHTMRYHAHYHTAGEGHVYQGRFKSFPVQDDDHF
jgi:putative transposase